MSFFGTLRRVKKGKKPTEHQITHLRSLQNTLTCSPLSSCSSTPNLELIPEQCVVEDGGETSRVRMAVDNLSLGGSSLCESEDYDDESLCTSESADTCSVCSESINQAKGHRHLSMSFRKGNPTQFVARTSEILRRMPKNRRFKGSTPVLNQGLRDRYQDGLSPMSSMRRYSSEGSRSKMLSSSSAMGSTMSLSIKSDDERKHDAAMINGVKKFNWDPKKGVEYFQAHGLVGADPLDVAQHLLHCENLSKTAVGTYLGEHDDFCQEVMRSFVSLQDFKGKSIVESMRKFLTTFRLPGEAQKIDRIIEAFATHYCEQNPNVFSNMDACHLLSYAIIMLNTTLHNPNVKEKPTAEKFLQMNRGVDFGDSVDSKFLLVLYHEIKREEFKIPDEEGAVDLKLTFHYADLKGWLWKRGENHKSWKKRWFVLSDNCLYYFKHVTDKNPRTIIPLENIDAVEGSKHPKYSIFYLKKTSESETEFIKSCKRLHDGTMVLGRHSKYVLGASNPEERNTWVQAIQQNSCFDFYYTLIQEKKRNLLALQSKPTGRQRLNSPRKSQIRKSQISMPTCRPHDPCWDDHPREHYEEAGDLDSISVDTATRETYGGGTVAGDTISGDTIAAETIAGGTITAETTAGGTITGGTNVKDTTAGDTIPGGSTTGDTIPGETTTGDTIPGETTTGDTIPGETTTGDTIPGETTTGDTIPGETTTGDTIPGETTTGDTIAAETTTGDTIAGDPIAGVTIFGDPITGGTIAGAPITGVTIFGDPITGVTIAGDPITGGTIAGETTTQEAFRTNDSAASSTPFSPARYEDNVPVAMATSTDDTLELNTTLLESKRDPDNIRVRNQMESTSEVTMPTWTPSVLITRPPTEDNQADVPEIPRNITGESSRSRIITSSSVETYID